MREIRFRAWLIKDKIVLPVKSLDFNDGKAEPRGKFGRSWIHEKGRRVFDAWWDHEFEFKEVVLMQFTGLYDKNGKEIWEGDIARFADDGIVFKIGEVIFKNGMFMACHGQTIPQNHLFTDLQTYKCKVLGNIYENPDLLKGQSNAL